MRPFEIYNAQQRFNDCDDMRPWLVIEVRAGGVYACFPIASEHHDESHFPIDAEHPDFPATGLKKSCHILDARIYELNKSQFQRRRGELVGAMLAAFREYAGL